MNVIVDILNLRHVDVLLYWDVNVIVVILNLWPHDGGKTVQLLLVYWDVNVVVVILNLRHLDGGKTVQLLLVYSDVNVIVDILGNLVNLDVNVIVDILGNIVLLMCLDNWSVDYLFVPFKFSIHSFIFFS